MNPYNVTFTVPTTWGSISATSLLFIGTITALAANGPTVQVRSKKAGGAGNVESLVPKAWIQYKVPTDLADVQFQAAAGGAVIMLDGNTVAKAANIPGNHLVPVG